MMPWPKSVSMYAASEVPGGLLVEEELDRGPTLSAYCDGCRDICLSVASDGGVRLSLLTSTVAGQVDGRSLGGLTGRRGSGLKIVEIQASTSELVGSCR